MKKIEEILGYEKMIDVWRALYFELTAEKIGQFERQSNLQALMGEKIDKFLKMGYSFDEAVRLAKEEMIREQNEEPKEIINDILR